VCFSSFRTYLAAYSQLSEAVAHWHRAVIWSTWMCRCGHPSAVVLPEDEVDVCDYARLVLEVLWDSIALHCDYDYDYDYDPHSGGGQTHRQAGKTHKKARRQ